MKPVAALGRRGAEGDREPENEQPADETGSSDDRHVSPRVRGRRGRSLVITDCGGPLFGALSGDADREVRTAPDETWCDQPISHLRMTADLLRSNVEAVILEGENTMKTPEDAGVDRALKAKHRALWAAGDYPAVAAELIPSLGPELVRAAEVRPGDRVLDVAAGSGNAAIPAAVAGAVVTASDLTPELFDAGRRIAADRDVELEWVEADAEALPFADDSFDVVMSCVGAMFAPHHQTTADELLRVVRPGGTVAMINWTPEGFIGNLFKTMKPYAPPPPPGASPAPLWGDENHIRELFGDRVVDLTMRRQIVVLDHCAEPLEFREYWKRNYGPTIAAYKFNSEQPDRVEALDRDFLSFLTTWDRGDTGRASWEAEYLLVTASKR
jgi:SAM-dependent methyltransferase